MDEINWKSVEEKFETDMAQKLAGLPGHTEVPANLKMIRGIISHELPEMTSIEDFQKLIRFLVNNENEKTISHKVLNHWLKKETDILNVNIDLYNKLKISALNWVKENLTEETLQKLWKEHKTWLPRRYTLYLDPNTSFQIIAADTLARYHFIDSGIRRNDTTGKIASSLRSSQ